MSYALVGTYLASHPSIPSPVNTNNSMADRRGSFRCPVADSRQGCMLQVGAERLPARLLDESAGGFSVLVERPAGLVLDVGQTVQLQSDSGWFEVRVVRVVEAEPPDGNDAQHSEDGPGSWFRLGLLRLHEIPPDQPSVSVFVSNRYFGLQSWYPSGSLLTATGLLLVLAMLAIPLGLVAMVWHDGQPMPGTTLAALKARRTGGASARTIRDPQRRAGPARGKETAWQSPHLIAGDRGPDCAGELPALPAPTRDQQQQLRHLQNATAEALRKLSLDWVAHSKWRQNVERRTELVRPVRGEARKLLTEEQRAHG